MKFHFKDPASEELATVDLDDDFIREQMSEHAFDKLCDCRCEPDAPESNVIECVCADKYEKFVLVNN